MNTDGLRGRRVTIVEVGPRDGLQNEKVTIPTDDKVAFVDALTGAGLPIIEVSAFVNPKRVPLASRKAAVSVAKLLTLTGGEPALKSRNSCCRKNQMQKWSSNQDFSDNPYNRVSATF